MNDPNSPTQPPDHDSVLKNLEARHGEASRILLPDSASEESPLLVTGTGQEGDVPVRRGSYRVLGEIARGGVGVILKSHDPDLGRDVAMKILRDEHKDNTALLQRFVEEAQISGQLQHPGIAPVYEMGLREDERPYFTMKLIKGRTLSALLEDRDSPREGRHRFLRIFEQICQTMAYAHSRGVIHRDLKPANVMVGAFGEVQVMDWGFAKVLARGGVDDEKRALARESAKSVIQTVRSGPGSSTQSLAGSVLGTPANMPPEQARGEIDKTDERSDVFSLGGILVEILTGKSLYGSEEDPIVAAAECRLDATMKRLDECGAEDELEKLCRSCLAPAQAARPRNAEVLARRVQEYLGAVDERAREAELRATRARGRQRLALLVALFIVLGTVGGGGAYFWIQQQAARHRETVEGAIAAAMTEASTSHGLAQGDESGDLTYWDESLEALARVRSMVEDPGTSAATRSQVDELRGEIEAGRAAAVQRFAVRDHHDEFLAQLNEILYGHSGPEDSQEPDGEETYLAWATGEYARVFADFGLDLASMDVDEACAAIADHALAFELSESLDQWARLARAPELGIDWRKLVQVAQAADPDEDRNVVRDAVLERDVDALLALASDPDVLDLPAPTLALLGNSLLAEGRVDESLSLMRVAHVRYTGDLAINGMLAVVLREIQPLREESLRYWFPILAMRPDSIPLRDGLIDLLRETGHAEQAIAMARSVVELVPEDSHAYYQLGETLGQFGDAAGAVEALTRAIELGGGDFGAYLGLGYAHDALGDTEQAMACYDRAMEFLAPGETGLRVHLERAKYALAEEDWQTALQEFAESSSYSGGYHAGLVHLLLGNTQEAEFHIKNTLRELRRALRDNPRNNLGRGMLALSLSTCPLEQYRDPVEALRHAMEAVRRNPHEPATWTALAAARFRSQDYHGALRACHEARDRLLVGAQLLSVRLLIQCMAEWHLGEKEQALRTYEAAQQEMQPRTPLIHQMNRLACRWLQVEAAELLGVPH